MIPCHCGVYWEGKAQAALRMCNRGPHQPGDLREASYLDRVWGGSIFCGGETPRCEGVLGRGERATLRKAGAVVWGRWRVWSSVDGQRWQVLSVGGMWSWQYWVPGCGDKGKGFEEVPRCFQ